MLEVNRISYILKTWLRHRKCSLAKECANYNKFMKCGSCWRADIYIEKKSRWS